MKKIMALLAAFVSMVITAFKPSYRYMTRATTLDLQYFAEAGTLVNATGNYVNSYTGETEAFVPGVSDLSSLDKTYYDTTVLDNARDQLIFTQLGKHQNLPAHHGQTVEFRRWQTLGRVHKIIEGVIPKGRKLSQVAITCRLSQWGDYITISDLLDAHSIDEPKTAAAEELGAAGGLTNDLLTRNALLGGTSIIFSDVYDGDTYSSTPSTEEELQTALEAGKTSMLKVIDINKAVTFLKVAAKMKTFDGKWYVAVIHPYVAEDLRSRDKMWIEAHIYADVEPLFAGEIGRMHGVRFIESNNAPIIKNEGDTYATFKTLFFAKDAFGVIDAEGGGMQTIIKTKGEIGGPLEQYGTVGVKFEMAAKILYQERMVAVWSGSSYSKDAEQNITWDDEAA